MAMVIGVALLVPFTILALLTRESDRRRAPSNAERLAVVAVVGLAAFAVGRLLDLPTAQATGIAMAYVASIVLWLPATRDWATHGTVTWALTVDVAVVYLIAMGLWTFAGTFTWWGMASSLALWIVEIFVAILGAAYVWEFVDVLTRVEWPASVDPEELPHTPAPELPFVSLHVPAHNEPPDMVIETLEHLVRMDYPAFEILLLDNNTTDPALWRPVEEWCAGHPNVKFIHLEDWPGYKSGALNYGLTQTSKRAEVIGIIDADYIVDASFLKDCAPLFADPEVAFVQTPQDYRDWEKAPYFRRLYLSYGYFFDVSQRSRNERNGAIFGGTMGLIRRSALDDVGGWDEWCITEDAELSLRLLKRGGRGLHVDQAYGKGMMPLTFEALKRQRFRWCFGGIQILRMHWRSLLPGPVTRENQMNNAQRWAYLGGGIQWYGDAASLLLTLFLIAGAADAIFYEGIAIRELSAPMLGAIGVLVVVGSLRALALLRRSSGSSWREAIGAFGIWLGTGWTVAKASVRGLFAREGAFLRTPKVRGELNTSHAIRANLPETVLAVSCIIIAIASAAQADPGPIMIAGLLLMQAAGYAAAPLNSIAAIRADLPETLRYRRTTLEKLAVGAQAGGAAVGVLAVAGLVIAMLAAPAAGPQQELPGWAKQPPHIREAVPDAPAMPKPPASEPSTPAPSGAPTAPKATSSTSTPA
ncbi:MAG TPA: glycosyltransferase, partial [Aeromicrobium sp.]|nr:glycosyltransferase [Aeromicrobium sp.]